MVKEDKPHTVTEMIETETKKVFTIGTGIRASTWAKLRGISHKPGKFIPQIR